MTSYLLDIVCPGEPRQTRRLDDGLTTVGRSADNALVLDDQRVSRHHAEVVVGPDSVKISDAGSANGTQVNDVRLIAKEWRVLRAGDRIDIGPYRLTLAAVADEPKTGVFMRPEASPEPSTPSPAPPPPSRMPVRPPASSENIEPPPVLAPQTPPRRAPAPVAMKKVDRTRTRSLSLCLLIVSALLTLPTGIAAWQDRVIMDRQSFIKLGNDVLAKDVVQRELAKDLSEEIGTSILGADQLLKGVSLNDADKVLSTILGPDKGSASGSATRGKPDDVLGGLLDSLLEDPKKPSGETKDDTEKQIDAALQALLGPSSNTGTPSGGNAAGDSLVASLTQPIALEVLQTLPNTEIADLALGEAHHTLTIVVRKDEPDRVVLNLDEELDRILKEIGVPIKTKEIGPSLGDVLIIDRHDLPLILRIARWFDGKVYLLLALTVVALVAGLYLAMDRVRYVLYAGIAMAVSSVLWIALVRVPLRSWSTAKVEHQASARGAINAAYDVISGSFVQQELLVLSAGIAVAVLGLFLLRRAAPPPQTGEDAGRLSR